MTERTERDDILDFPGADELIAAAAVPPPSESRITDVQEVLTLLMDREATAVQAVTRRGDPQPELAPPEEPLVVIGHEEAAEATATRGRLSRRRVLVGSGAVAVVAAGALALPALDLGSKPASPAASFLNEMAEVSSQQAPLPRGRYWKVRVETRRKTRTWSTTTSTLYGDRAGNTWERDPDGKVVKSPENVGWWEVGRERLTWPELDRLPTDPEALARHFSKSPLHRFEEVTKLLEESPAGPQLRSALFKVVEDVPGVRLQGTGKDSHGRPGTVMAFMDKRTFKGKGGEEFYGGIMHYCMIDPKTSRILQVESAPDGSFGQTTYLELGWTSHID
ncbi:hypothetical protein ABT124_05340 [Streptomyces sp. NPDC001982]|uniref:hypothetical protein n=1 Tax=Streptomyces sp. NPDC001982 TaxID=3154405 RepID=UPI00331BAF9E